MVLRKKNTQSNKALTLKKRLIAHNNPENPIVEQYRTIRTNIQFSVVDEEIKTVLITSTGRSEGKSTTAVNLATVYAQQGIKVLLVDADLRKPTAHYTFRTENHIGLTNVLTKQARLTDAVQYTEIPNLYILTSGPVPPNPSELLSSNYMNQVLDEIKQEFNVIIVDSPPVLAVTDAQILANKLDGTILVVSSGKTSKEVAIKARDLLKNANAKILGVVLNNKKLEGESDYYYYETK